MQSTNPPSVSYEEESAFDELFFACCPSGRDVARVEDIVTRICDIRKESDEVSVYVVCVCVCVCARACGAQAYVHA